MVHGLDRVPFLVILCKSHTHVFDFHPKIDSMLKRCIFTICDRATGEIIGQHDKVYNIEVESQRKLVHKILARFVDIAYEKGIDVNCVFTCRPPKDSIESLEIPDFF